VSAGRSLTVARAGALTTIQDDGRPGLAHLGVGRSGALDRDAHHLANRLVANPEAAPVLETTVDGVAVVLDGAGVIAVTGAFADVRVDGRPVDWGVPVHVAGGERIDVARAQRGVRSYLAIAGAITVAPVLHSASTDLLSGLGPAPLSTGDVVALGASSGPSPAIDMAPYRPAGDQARLRIHPGPRRDWLSAAGATTLTSATWTVSPDSNRIALRLQGAPVQRARRDELPSEGIVLGAVQSLPDGGFVVFLADHPTTGGYPVVAVVDPGCLGACAPPRPGSGMTLRWARGSG
jgi:biotin-dependent carboxylase-like uncharacterized protein